VHANAVACLLAVAIIIYTGVRVCVCVTTAHCLIKSLFCNYMLSSVEYLIWLGCFVFLDLCIIQLFPACINISTTGHNK